MEGKADLLVFALADGGRTRASGFASLNLSRHSADAKNIAAAWGEGEEDVALNVLDAEARRRNDPAHRECSRASSTDDSAYPGGRFKCEHD